MNNIIKNDLLGRLTQAVSTLEMVIISSTESIKAKGNFSNDAFERLDSYMQIVNRQKRELPLLAIHMANNDLQKVEASCKRIAALSKLVRDDAKEFMSVLIEPEAKHIRAILVN
jgi:hypothetical protein